MRKVEFNEKGMVDAETGEPIDINSPEFKEMARRPPKPKDDSSPSTSSQDENPPQAEQLPPDPKKDAPSPSLKDYKGVKPVSYTKYEVTPDTQFTIRFCLSFDDSGVHVYTADEKPRHPEFELHWVTFRMWTYREQLSWRQQCTTYDQITGLARIESDRYNELKLRNLIRSWSFEEYDSKFKLLHANGILSDESWGVINGMYPVIVDNIVFMMNRVLEESA